VSEAVPPENLKLRRKLFLARKAAEKVEKQGHNRDGDFTYARAEDVLEEASRQLEKRDILILGSLIEEELILGKSGVLAKVVIEYTVTDSKTGEELPPIRWVGTGVDTPGDKALFKATTGCEKYFLAKLLGIPFGTDPEAEIGPADTESAEAQHRRDKQDRITEQPDEPAALRPVPESELPEVDWTAEQEAVVNG